MNFEQPANGGSAMLNPEHTVHRGEFIPRGGIRWRTEFSRQEKDLIPWTLDEEGAVVCGLITVRSTCDILYTSSPRIII